jgi:hypothetical protein
VARPRAGIDSDCGLGVRTRTRCGLPSAEITVRSTARKAGEETERGSRAPPGRTLNVAGRRTRVEPPAGAVVPVDPPAGPGCAVVVLVAGAVVAVTPGSGAVVAPGCGAVAVRAGAEGTVALDTVAGVFDDPHAASRTRGTIPRANLRRLTLSA